MYLELRSITGRSGVRQVKIIVFRFSHVPVPFIVSSLRAIPDSCANVELPPNPSLSKIYVLLQMFPKVLLETLPSSRKVLTVELQHELIKSLHRDVFKIATLRIFKLYASYEKLG